MKQRPILVELGLGERPAGEASQFKEAVSSQEQKQKGIFFAAALSAILPGLGQLYKRDWLKAGVFFFLLAVLMALVAVVRLPRTYAGYWLIIAALIALACAAVADTLFSASRQATMRPTSQWWAAACMPPAIVVLWSLIGLWATVAGFRAYQVPSSSMEPTVQQGERILADLHYYRRHPIGRGDVVILKREDIFQITRVIGLPGDTVEDGSAGVIVNDRVISEPYAIHKSYDQGEHVPFGPVTVPPGQLFVLGDNRDFAFDSRHPQYAPARIQDVKGRALYLIYGTSDERAGMKIE